MLDRMDTLHLGMYDGAYPYVVPLNFGYDWEEDLVFYIHCARAGHKLDCLRQNPHVCAAVSSFISYAGGSVRGHLHDYRSVIARGVAQEIDRETEPQAFARAMARILAHNGRDPAGAGDPATRYLCVWRIVCRAEDVTAKAEIPPKRAQDVPFLRGEGDGQPLDESHILDMR